MRIAVAVLVVAALLLVGAPRPARAAADGCPDPQRLPPTPFRDISGSAHRDAVVCADWYGVVKGTSRDTFAPARGVRRDQMAAYLARLLTVAEGPVAPTQPTPLRDVGDSVHRDAIAVVTARGVIEPTPDGRFLPRAHVTRSAAATWLVHLVTTMGVQVSNPPDAFDDDQGSPDEGAVNAAAALGLVRGRADGTFGADGRVRRAQAAALVARTIRLLVRRGLLQRRPVPSFSVRRTALPDALRRRMTGTTWRRGCPVPLDDLVLLTLTHWDYGADVRRGRLIVARSVAADVSSVFARLYAARFQIHRMRPVHTFDRGEAGSLAANNTSAFNCRAVTGGGGWSQHSYGTAIDINPRQNPYVRGGTVLPANGVPWLRRAPLRRGMIGPRGPVVAAFTAIGWGWGGTWRTRRDYQHFSANGR